MKYVSFKASGSFAHFKKPETNNNPISFSLMHKVAAIGMLGNITGIEREEMKPFYPILCEDLLFGIKVLTPLVKESHGVTGRKAIASEKFMETYQKTMEFIRDPSYEIFLALKVDRSSQQFENLIEFIKKEETCYQPCLGIQSCLADVTFLSTGDTSSAKIGEFTTRAVVSSSHKIKNTPENSYICVESIPTLKNSDGWYNPRDKYVKVLFDSDCNPLTVEGPYHEIGEDKIWLF